MSIEVPSAGSIVNYGVENGTRAPAIVTGTRPNGALDLVVFLDRSNAAVLELPAGTTSVAVENVEPGSTGNKWSLRR